MQAKFTNIISVVSICTAQVLAAGILGNDSCTQGPSYWCSNEANASQCSFADPEINCQKYCGELVDSPFCSDVIQESLPEESPIMGSDPCTWGPDYWCTSEETAIECGFENPETECKKYCTDLENSPFCEPLMGSNPCTWGPSYWCASEANAIECKLENPETDCQQYCTDLEDSPFCSGTLAGSDPCTWGPSYWCASEENAQVCNFENPQEECQRYCDDVANSPFC